VVCIACFLIKNKSDFAPMPSPSTASKPLETITVKTSTFYCDGGARAGASDDSSALLGHPRVFLTMTAQGSVDCPYCGRHFVLAADAKPGSGH
jgi:uncharacterized Zn-finger protein